MTKVSGVWSKFCNAAAVAGDDFGRNVVVMQEELGRSKGWNWEQEELWDGVDGFYLRIQSFLEPVQ